MSEDIGYEALRAAIEALLDEAERDLSIREQFILLDAVKAALGRGSQPEVDAHVASMRDSIAAQLRAASELGPEQLDELMQLLRRLEKTDAP